MEAHLEDYEEEELYEEFIIIKGFSNKKGTKPGFSMKNDSFSVRFESIQIEKNSNVQTFPMSEVKDEFETCYDWAPIMEMILDCLEYYHDNGAFQISCELSFNAWLSEFGGLGLLTTLLPRDFQVFLIVLFAQMRWKNIRENVVKSSSELFEDLIELYEHETTGHPLSDLAPIVEAKLQNMITCPTASERKKMLTVKFHGDSYLLIANFSVEKIRLRRTLVEHAAEVVARLAGDVEELDIPETLKEVVDEKVRDHKWVMSHWYARLKYVKHENDLLKLKYDQLKFDIAKFKYENNLLNSSGENAEFQEQLETPASEHLQRIQNVFSNILSLSVSFFSRICRFFGRG